MGQVGRIQSFVYFGVGYSRAEWAVKLGQIKTLAPIVYRAKQLIVIIPPFYPEFLHASFPHIG